MEDSKEATLSLLKPKRPTIDPRLLNPQGALQKKMSLPGFNDTPFRGSAPFLKDTDDPTRLPKTGYQVHVELFDMSDVDDRIYYAQVWQLAANGYAMISADERQYDEDKKTWRVFLRWGVPYSYMPGGDRNG